VDFYVFPERCKVERFVVLNVKFDVQSLARSDDLVDKEATKTQHDMFSEKRKGSTIHKFADPRDGNERSK
jgi:hypothetical protein